MPDRSRIASLRFWSPRCPLPDFTLVFAATETRLDTAHHRFVSTYLDAIAAAPCSRRCTSRSASIRVHHDSPPVAFVPDLMDGPARSQAYPGARVLALSTRPCFGWNTDPEADHLRRGMRAIRSGARRSTQSMSYACLRRGLERRHDPAPRARRDREGRARGARGAAAIADSRNVVGITDEPLVSVDYLKEDTAASSTRGG